ncbi:hypothetical protein SCHPADRAFT_816754, partial [Schizopora paradoxa]
SPFGSSGISALDEQLVSSSSEHPSLVSPLNRGDVLEIQGPPASGKTQLNYHLVMNCILPRELLLMNGGPHFRLSTDQGHEIGGWGRGAVVLDCDGRWDVSKLKHMLYNRLLKEQQKLKGAELASPTDELVLECLKRVHIFKPRSTLSMACTILRLPQYHAQHMGSLEIALLVVDPISSFYWQDKLFVEQKRNADDNKDPTYPMDHFLTTLQNFRLVYGPVIIMANWGLWPLSNQGPSPFYRQHLYPFPSPFEFPARVLVNAHLYPPITHHITLSLPPLERIPQEKFSLSEAEELQKRRDSTTEVIGTLRFVSTGASNTFTMKIGPNGITS